MLLCKINFVFYGNKRKLLLIIKYLDIKLDNLYEFFIKTG